MRKASEKKELMEVRVDSVDAIVEFTYSDGIKSTIKIVDITKWEKSKNKVLKALERQGMEIVKKDRDQLWLRLKGTGTRELGQRRKRM